MASAIVGRDDGGRASVAVLEDLEQVATLGVFHRCE